MFKQAFAAAAVSVLGTWAAPALAIEGPYEGRFDARALDLGNLVGALTIEVGGDDMSVAITGRKDELDYITVVQDGDVLSIRSTKTRRRVQGRPTEIAEFKLRVPEGTPLDGDLLIGTAAIGDLNAPVDLEVTALRARIGDVTEARVRINGSSKLVFSDIEGDLTLDIDGSGDLIAKTARRARVDINGSGAAEIGRISDGLDADVSGSGDIKAVEVNGPIAIEVAGAGDVRLGKGSASSLRVRIMGSGNFAYEGTAHNPDIAAYGTADVYLAAYTGRLSTKGQADLRIGR